MFTGIVEEKALVKKIEKSSSGVKLHIKAEKALNDVKVGDSIAINGTCLTVTAIQSGILEFDVMAETLRMTTLSGIRSGEIVNAERSLRAGDRISGHFVTGHIDCIGTVNSVSREPNNYIIRIKIPLEKVRYVVPKGSVSIDGVSLTISETGGNYFNISLIPLTLKGTSLSSKKAGDKVNIEFDILAKYALSGSQQGDSKINAGFLKKHGFV